MTADLSDVCGNGNGCLVHGMPVSRIAQQLASDVVEPAVLANMVKLSCLIHLPSLIASIEPISKILLFPRQITLNR